MKTLNVKNPTKSTKSGISIYDMEKDRIIYYKNPYGVKAKKAYTKYLSIDGYDASMVLPPT